MKNVVDRVLAEDSAGATSLLKPEYWHWYDNVDNRLVKQLANDDLRAAWTHTGRVHKQFLKACQSAVTLAAKGETARARIQLHEVFSLSNELTGLLVGGSIAELVSAIQSHEQLLATRYERDFLEATHMGRFTLRLSDNLLMEADDSFLDFCGYTREDLIGSPINILLSKQSQSRMLAAARNMEKTERVALKAKHGAGHPITLDVIAYIDHDNGIELLHAFAVNVTQTETEAQQRRLLSTAVEASGQSVLITNGAQEIIYINPAFTRMTGYASEEVMGKTPLFLQGAETRQATRVAIREALAAN